MPHQPHHSSSSTLGLDLGLIAWTKPVIPCAIPNTAFRRVGVHRGQNGHHTRSGLVSFEFSRLSHQASCACLQPSFARRNNAQETADCFRSSPVCSRYPLPCTWNLAPAPPRFGRTARCRRPASRCDNSDSGRPVSTSTSTSTSSAPRAYRPCLASPAPCPREPRRTAPPPS